MTKIETLSIEELGKISATLSGDDSGRDIIVDVRTPEEFAEGHVPGAINAPHDQIAKHLHLLEGKDRIYLYCRSGGRVQVAHAELVTAGIADSVHCLIEGGMPDWIEAGLPVEKK